MARSERAVWLTERLGECVQDGTIIPVSQAQQQQSLVDNGSGALVRKRTYSRRQGRMEGVYVDRTDPLGLLQLNTELKRKGWVVLQVVSGFGIIGGLAFWIARSWTGVDGEGQFWGLGMRDWVELGRFDWSD